MNFRYKFFIFFVSIFLIFSGHNISQGYDDTTTHPALTDEIVDFYNLFFDLKITPEEKEWIIQGSHDEDTIPRWINHFIDPAHNNQGWTGEKTGFWPDWIVRSASYALIADKKPVSSLDWLHNQELQTAYSQYGGNRTWERALYELAVNNNGKEAYYTLGFILHLIEDATVPEHTRNDTHAADVKDITLDEGSPYEIFTAQFDRQNFNIAGELKNKGLKPVIKNSIDDYLIELAKYSNNNFFSKDTIEKYKKPAIVEKDENFGYGVDNYNKKFKLIKIDVERKIIDNEAILSKTYSLLNKPAYYPILQDYFTLLSRQAIINGAGIINLFHQEAEKAKQNPEKLNPPPVFNPSDQIISFLNEKTKSGFIEAVVLTTAKKFYRDVILKPADVFKTLIFQSNPSPAAVLQKSSQNAIETLSEIPKTAKPSPLNFTSEITPLLEIQSNFANPNTRNLEAKLPSNEIPTYIYAIPPAKKASPTIVDRYGLTAIPAAAGAGGGSEIARQPQQTQSQAQPSVSQSPPSDTTPPIINSFSVLECQNSLSSQNCLIATTTVNLIWNSSDSNINYYELTRNNSISTTTTASAVFIFQNNATNSISLRAKDKSGNWSATSTASAEINTMPIVINEVAWMGTATNSSDEWMELYNQTNKTIKMENFVLYSETDLTPYIKLASSTSPFGYYILERTNDNAVSDITADKIYTGALNNSGEIIILAYIANNATTTLDRIILNSNGAWPAGDNNTKETMQKNENSWCAAIATPKAENNCQNRVSQSPPADTTPPNPPVIISPSNFNQTFTTTTINFQGTAEANSAITANYLLNSSTATATTTVSNLGEWSLSLTLNQGTTTINFYAKDSSQNQSQAKSVQLFVDSIGPTIDTFSITECSSGQNCQVATTTLHLLWNSSDSDINYYELSYGNNISTTTSASMILTLQDNAAYSFSLRTKDWSGNWSTTSIKTVSINIPIDNTPPNAPAIASPSNFNQTFASSTINFQGTAEANSTVQAIYLFNNSTTTATTTASSTGNWSLTLSLNQATTTINFYSVDLANNTSSSSPATLFIDSLGPEISSFAISQCASSLSSDGCLTATTTLNLIWSSSNQDINYYELSYGSNTGTTTATSTTLTLADNSSYSFSLRATDLSGNWSATSTASAEISVMPVVINEIGWMGIGPDYSSDEFIELYNRTSKTINLNNFVLYSNDLTPYINLTQSIASSSYYLLERTNNSTISDIAADQTYTGGLNNNPNAETLFLVYVSGNSTTTIDYIPPCGSNWCAGVLYRSMERIDTDIAGAVSNNWLSNNMLIVNGKNAGRTAINATPKARNSANYLIANGEPYISSDITLLKSKSPYLVNNTIQVFQGNSTLTIEPGTVIKFYNDAGLYARNGAKILANGATNEPIVFTSFDDDDYGGDTNQNATSTAPAPGSWFGVSIELSDRDSEFSNAIFRYGGKYYNGMSMSRANLNLENASASITSSTFEYSKIYGLRLVNSTSTISESVIRFNNQNTDPAGYASAVLIHGGSPTIQSNSFSNNWRGLFIVNAPLGVIVSNIFSANTETAVYSNGLIANFSGNSGSNNGYNAISISGNITSANSTSTLAANDLPYAIINSGPTVVANSTLVIPSGIVLKSDDYLFVNGKLIIDGANAGDVIFTSLYDDSVSGDTTNNGNTIPAVAGQAGGISATSGGLLEIRGLTARYAGTETYGGSNSAPIMINNAKANIANSKFENNYPHGIYASNSTDLKIENSSFENHNRFGSWGTKAALAAFNSTTTLSNVSFANNALGIMSDTVSKFTASFVSFINNTVATSPANLW